VKQRGEEQRCREAIFDRRKAFLGGIRQLRFVDGRVHGIEA
jgi:hypothetical protein